MGMIMLLAWRNRGGLNKQILTVGLLGSFDACFMGSLFELMGGTPATSLPLAGAQVGILALSAVLTAVIAVAVVALSALQGIAAVIERADELRAMSQSGASSRQLGLWTGTAAAVASLLALSVGSAVGFPFSALAGHMLAPAIPVGGLDVPGLAKCWAALVAVTGGVTLAATAHAAAKNS
jgi:hypothetical protein